MKSEQKTTRVRLPMDKFKAAAAIDRILAQIPGDQRAAVLAFVAFPHEDKQLTIGGTA